MNPRNTGLWILFASGLFAFIYFYELRVRKPATGPALILPSLKAAAVKVVEVKPRGQLEIRADRTNQSWQLVEPFPAPAQVASIEGLLAALEHLTSVAFLAEPERRAGVNPDEEYGFADPQATIVINRGDYRLRIGKKTAPGDQVYLKVVGLEGAYVVDAELLKLVPRNVNDWRDTTLVPLQGLAFDRISVTNGTKSFELQRAPTNRIWRMTFPLPVRADNARIEDSLEKLQSLQIQQFVTDDPKADLESLGLQPADLELVLTHGTNPVAWLQFGKSPTNDAHQVYARQFGQQTVVTVTNDLLAAWRLPVNSFRDPHLLSLNAPVAGVEVRGVDHFFVELQTDVGWHVRPQDFMADPALVAALVGGLNAMPIVEFHKEVVTPEALPTYGLAPPVRQYILFGTNSAAGATNLPLAEVSFGTNQADNVFARRSDESAVYLVSTNDYRRLPAASWEMRERKLWKFNEDDVASVVIRHHGKIRQIMHPLPHKWKLAPGSQGIIEDFAVDQTVRGLALASAVAWVATGNQNRERYGITDDGLQVMMELRDGQKAVIEIGGRLASNVPYAAVTFSGEPWIMEFPPLLYRDVVSYLSIPADIP
jgi:hypothetical protein